MACMQGTGSIDRRNKERERDGAARNGDGEAWSSGSPFGFVLQARTEAAQARTEAAQARRAAGPRAFREGDLDHDGTLSRAEFVRAGMGDGDAFRAADLDGDGAVTLAEAEMRAEMAECRAAQAERRLYEA